MKKSTISILFSAMIAMSGIAVAQRGPPVKSGTDGGEGPSAAEIASPGSMSRARAEVKAEAAPMKAGLDGGEGPVPNSTKMTAAERRAAAANTTKRGTVSRSDLQKDGRLGSAE